jgi:hypothetical protein
MEVSSDEDTINVYRDKITNKSNIPINYGSTESSDDDNIESRNYKSKDTSNSDIDSPKGNLDLQDPDSKDENEKVELPLGWKGSKNNKKKYANISKDLEKYDFPDMIKTKANLLASQLKLKSHKNKPKLQQIFFLITSAYAECGQLCDDNRIAKELGLKQTDINRARAIYNQVRTGYVRPQVPSAIPNWILTHLSDIGLSEDLKDDVDYLIKSILVKEKNLRTEGAKIIMKNKKIKDNYPQDIALAGILYELELRAIIEDKDKKNKEKLIFSLGRKPNVVLSLLNYIKKIDNNV